MLVPAGPFLMGSRAEDTVAFDDEKPQHEVDLPGFWIMRTEVTNAQYARCVAAAIGRCDPPANDFWNQPEFADHPVTHVNWEQAGAYAHWVGGRLPTEAEWEKACRGLDNRIYPWGAYEPNSERLNFDGNVGAPTKVGSYPEGASPYGALDMAGNVWEWTADWYGGEYYAQSPGGSPPGPEEGNRRTLRGGQWDNNERWVRCANRYRRDPFDGAGYGFRVVRSE
ncbi:MAG: SUMF1/EgtB/PvdO family nonheme iron enzyme [Caldilineaceae bacterium]|nr:SUMF1/EgtB/PvdO family nonheme iron enzyme [Caldilineaceae bacterium]